MAHPKYSAVRKAAVLTQEEHARRTTSRVCSLRLHPPLTLVALPLMTTKLGPTHSSLTLYASR